MEKLVLRAEASLDKKEIRNLAGNVAEVIDDCLSDICCLDLASLTRSSKELLLKGIFDELLGSEEA